MQAYPYLLKCHDISVSKDMPVLIAVQVWPYLLICHYSYLYWHILTISYAMIPINTDMLLLTESHDGY